MIHIPKSFYSNIYEQVNNFSHNNLITYCKNHDIFLFINLLKIVVDLISCTELN